MNCYHLIRARQSIILDVLFFSHFFCTRLFQQVHISSSHQSNWPAHAAPATLTHPNRNPRVGCEALLVAQDAWGVVSRNFLGEANRFPGSSWEKRACSRFPAISWEITAIPRNFLGNNLPLPGSSWKKSPLPGKSNSFLGNPGTGFTVLIRRSF